MKMITHLNFSSKNFKVELNKEFKILNVELKQKWIGEISLHIAMI